METEFISLLGALAINGDTPVGDADWKSWTLLVVYLLIAIVFSFLCSVAEAAMLKVNGGFIESIRKSKEKASRLLENFRVSPEEPLSAILTLNTIAHTVGAAGVGHQASVIFGAQWLGLASAIMTVLILIGSEIIPKTLGATHWRRLAPISAVVVGWLQTLLKPLIRVMMLITDRITKKGQSAGNRSEVESTVQIVSESKEISKLEKHLLANVLGLRSIGVREILTPRKVVFSLPASSTAAEYQKAHLESPFSRIPIYTESIDDADSYVLRSDLLKTDEIDAPISTFKRDLLSLPKSTLVDQLFEQLMESDSHIALVVGEYGGTTGVVTLEDVFETLIGSEIVDESDSIVDLQELARAEGESRLADSNREVSE